MDREAIQERFGILGSSDAVRKIIDRIRLVADTEITVLLTGESGSGKELAAQAIHSLSDRRHADMVIVNCGAIPEGLVESELFGAERGAYTGAVERRVGYFEQANKGTILLDEIGEMPLAAQVRLLRVLESGEFSRVGSSKGQHADVRVIAATNKDLSREVGAGRFREDLYYRLSTVLIDIPPLRDRKGDIIPIFNEFLEEASRRYNAPFKKLSEAARQLLLEYRWPGNIRELRNVAEQTAILTRGNTVDADDLRPFLRGVTASSSELVLASELGNDEARDFRERELIYRLLVEIRLELNDLKSRVFDWIERTPDRPSGFDTERGGRPPSAADVRSLPARSGTSAAQPDEEVEDVAYEIQWDDALPPVKDENGSYPLPTIEDAEKSLIIEALKRFDGNRRQTAKQLGISERTLYRKLKSLDIETDDDN